jgi:uncharacterized protein
MNKTKFNRNAISVLIITFVIVFPHYVPLPFYSYAIVCLAVIILYLRKQKKTFQDFGLKRHGLTFKTLWVGVFSAVCWTTLMKWIYIPFINHFFSVPDYSEYDFLRNKLSALIITVIAAWIVGGFYEEIIFRGFIQTKIQEWFQRHNYAFWISGLLTSILFGLYHWQQGIFGVVSATLGGLFWTFLLRRYDGNLWFPILSHAIYDTIILTMIYLGIFGR